MTPYKYIVKSNSDPNGDKGGLGFSTLESAQEHCNIMNKLRLDYPNGWNVNFWKQSPEEYVILENEVKK